MQVSVVVSRRYLDLTCMTLGIFARITRGNATSL